eukprot:5785346-Pyramimonas_sp.AAC.1
MGFLYTGSDELNSKTMSVANHPLPGRYGFAHFPDSVLFTVFAEPAVNSTNSFKYSLSTYQLLKAHDDIPKTCELLQFFTAMHANSTLTTARPLPRTRTLQSTE